MRIEIDSGRCMGAGQCVLASEAVFDQNETTGEVRLLIAGAIPAEHEEAVRDAVATCPSGALALSG
ncbi:MULTISPECIES: ferredoxin [unclassified Streptomyces]|uniref:ferredoxin n=1 Tax=unclassified Streptomyces TaxID=2593676 RepID=UPI003642565B